MIKNYKKYIIMTLILFMSLASIYGNNISNGSINKKIDSTFDDDLTINDENEQLNNYIVLGFGLFIGISILMGFYFIGGALAVIYGFILLSSGVSVLISILVIIIGLVSVFKD